MADERLQPDQPLRIVGFPTPKAVIYKHESHKLHQAFSVAKTDGTNTDIIFQGNPVKLLPSGEITNYYDGDTDGIYIGIAMTDSPTPAYRTDPVEVTVIVAGFLIVRAMANDQLDCGYVVPTETDTSAYTVYEAAATGDTSKWIALLPADEEGDLIDVLVIP